MNIVTFTNLYPSAARPTHGVFVEERMTRLARESGAHLRVVAPVPWFPWTRGFGEYSKFAATPRRETRRGVEVLHPRVLTVPKLGMSWAPSLWTRACLPVVEALHGQRPIDVLDAHYLYPDGVAAVRIGDNLRIPVVLSARGTDVNVIAQIPGPRARIVEACSRARAVIAVSGALARSLQQIGVDGAKITVVQNGVDVESFEPRAGREALRIGQGRLLLGVGRLVPTKGWQFAIEAVARLLPRFPDLHLAIAGGGPGRGHFEALARSLGVAGRVTFLGDTEHSTIPKLLWGAHRFVFPSFREGHPNAVVEAVAAGVPVVATPVGGVPEIVDGRVGELSKDVSAASFTEALERSLNKQYDPEDFARRRGELRWENAIAKLRGVLESARDAAGVSP